MSKQTLDALKAARRYIDCREGQFLCNECPLEALGEGDCGHDLIEDAALETPKPEIAVTIPELSPAFFAQLTNKYPHVDLSPRLTALERRVDGLVDSFRKIGERP